MILCILVSLYLMNKEDKIMSIENEIANAAKEYGYNFIKDSVDADEVIRTFNDEGKVYVPETYNSADDVDIIYHKIVEKAKEKIGKDIDIDPDDYFFKFDKWIDSGILKVYVEILNCKIKIDNGYVRKMTEEEWYDFLKEIDAF